MDEKLRPMPRGDGGDDKSEESEGQSSLPATGSGDDETGVDDSPRVCCASDGISETVEEVGESEKASHDDKTGGNDGTQEVGMMTPEEAEDCLSKMLARDYSVWRLAFDFRRRGGAKALKYSSFGKCLEEEMGISRSQGTRWADAWEISMNLGVNRDTLEIPERTLRLFNPFKPDSQLLIYRKAMARHKDDDKTLHGHLVESVIDDLEKQRVLERKPRSERKRQEITEKNGGNTEKKRNSEEDLKKATRPIKDAGVEFAEEVVEELKIFIKAKRLEEENSCVVEGQQEKKPREEV